MDEEHMQGPIVGSAGNLYIGCACGSYLVNKAVQVRHILFGQVIHRDFRLTTIQRRVYELGIDLGCTKKTMFSCFRNTDGWKLRVLVSPPHAIVGQLQGAS